MADPNGAPRRVSMAYILGFSDRPYKEMKSPAPPPPPLPRKHTQPTNVITTPGCIVEWTASDGRKGRLTGTGKPRLTAASLAKMPFEKQSTKEKFDTKSTSKDVAPEQNAATGEDPWGGNNWGDTNAKFGSKHSGSKRAASNQGGGWDTQKSNGGNDNPSANTWPTAGNNPVSRDEPEKKDEDPNAWTKDQDEKLIQMKTDNATWDEICKQFGKDKDKCSSRFKEIKPQGWVPSAAKQRGGGGKKGKKEDKTSEQYQNQNNALNKKDAKKEQEKERDKTEEAPGGADAWNMTGGGVDGGVFGGDTGDSKYDSGNKDSSWDNTGGADTSLNINAWDIGNTTGGVDAANDAAVCWDFTSGGNWNTNTDEDQNHNIGGDVADPWTTTAPTQKPRSNQAASHSRSQHNASNNENTQPNMTRPLGLELRPDDTFSADDLRLVARILQQDCSMLWNRVSWRFRDKTGRTLHPNEFEKKITGRLEDKGSQKAERGR